MTSVNSKTGVSDTASAYGTTAANMSAAIHANDYVPLTPEGLLFFCQNQLKQLDEKINDAMQSQQKLVDTQGGLANIESLLHQYSDGKGAGDDAVAFDNDSTRIKTLDGAIDKMISDAKFAGNDNLVKSLESVKANVDAGADNKVTKDDVKAMCSTLDNAMTDLRSGAELTMINLQSLVSKRATALQLTTGMMSSMNDASKGIAANIGH